VSRSDQELALDALDHIGVLRGHMERGDLKDVTIADALNMRLAAAIETLAQATPDFREKYFGEEWPLMWATRNRISHGYAFVDIEIIQKTIENRLPHLEAQLRTALSEF